MSRGVLALSLVALALVMGAVFLGVGLRAATNDTEAARERAAASWSAAGGRPEDCAALRTDDGARVVCEGAAGRAAYLLGRDGVLREED